MLLRRSFVPLALGVVLALLAGACTSDDGPKAARGPGPVDAGVIEEAQEQAEKTELRLEALEQAREAGTLGVTERVRNAPRPAGPAR